MRRLWINYTPGIYKTAGSLMPLTSRRCWQRHVPPCCPHHGAPLQRLSNQKFQVRNQRDGEDEIDLKSFDERNSQWNKLSEHKRLLHFGSFFFLSLSPRFVRHTHTLSICCQCHTKLVLQQILMYNAACLSLSVLPSSPLLFEHPPLACVCACVCVCVWDGGPAPAAETPASLSISRDVRSDERRRKISKMSSLMSNTKCELSLFSSSSSGS